MHVLFFIGQYSIFYKCPAKIFLSSWWHVLIEKPFRSIYFNHSTLIMSCLLQPSHAYTSSSISLFLLITSVWLMTPQSVPLSLTNWILNFEMIEFSWENSNYIPRANEPKPEREGHPSNIWLMGRAEVSMSFWKFGPG